MQDERFIHRIQRQATGAGCFDPRHERFQLIHQRAMAFAQFLGRKAADLGAEGLFCAFPGEEHILQNGQDLGRDGGNPREFLCVLGICRPAGSQHLDSAGQDVGLIADKHLGSQRLQIVASGQLKYFTQRIAVEVWVKPSLPATNLGCQALEIQTPDMKGSSLDHMRVGALRHILGYFRTQHGGRAIFHFGKLRADTGLQRETAQER